MVEYIYFINPFKLYYYRIGGKRLLTNSVRFQTKFDGIPTLL